MSTRATRDFAADSGIILGYDPMLIQFSHHQILTQRSKTIVSPCPIEGCHASMALGPISSKKHGSERGVTRRSLAGGKVGLTG